MASATSYQGGSAFLRWWPKLLLALALYLLVSRGNHAVQWATLLGVLAYIHGRWLPSQFTIRDAGIELHFPFGRRAFLPKQSLKVRIEIVGATALLGRRHRFGYLLMDRVLYEPGREALLRTAFLGLGYQLT